jgi:hypothetical protein
VGLKIPTNVEGEEEEGVGREGSENYGVVINTFIVGEETSVISVERNSLDIKMSKV